MAGNEPFSADDAPTRRITPDDQETVRGLAANWDVIENYSDGFARTAPVGSFSPNRHGIYDLGGNVAERIGDRNGGLRGAAFDRSSRGDLASSDRSVLVHRIGYVGIRCVIAPGSSH